MTLPAPKHHWRFDEATGTAVSAAVGGVTIAIDRPSFVPGRFGNALRFNPADGVRLATTTLPELPPPWTAGFWVKREAASDGATLFSSTQCALKLEQWQNTHALGFTSYGGYDESFLYTAPLNQWVHLAMVGTATEVKLYANGAHVGSVPKSAGLGLRWLGSTGGYVEFASMLLDEVKIFDQALTDAQVGELAGEGTQPPAPPPPPPPPPPPAPPPPVPTANLTGWWSNSYFHVNGNALTIDNSKVGRPTATGTILGPNQIRVTFPDDATYTGTVLLNPPRILWSNNSIWPRIGA